MRMHFHDSHAPRLRVPSLPPAPPPPIINVVLSNPAARAKLPVLLSLVGAMGFGTVAAPSASGAGSGLNLDALMGLLG